LTRALRPGSSSQGAFRRVVASTPRALRMQSQTSSSAEVLVVGEQPDAEGVAQGVDRLAVLLSRGGPEDPFRGVRVAAEEELVEPVAIEGLAGPPDTEGVLRIRRRRGKLVGLQAALEEVAPDQLARPAAQLDRKQGAAVRGGDRWRRGPGACGPFPPRLRGGLLLEPSGHLVREPGQQDRSVGFRGLVEGVARSVRALPGRQIEPLRSAPVGELHGQRPFRHLRDEHRDQAELPVPGAGQDDGQLLFVDLDQGNRSALTVPHLDGSTLACRRGDDHGIVLHGPCIAKDKVLPAKWRLVSFQNRSRLQQALFAPPLRKARDTVTQFCQRDTRQCQARLPSPARGIQRGIERTALPQQPMAQQDLQIAELPLTGWRSRTPVRTSFPFRTRPDSDPSGRTDRCLVRQ
jgi:hypothetical protein